MGQERHEKDKVVYSGTQHEADKRIRGPHQQPERIPSQHDKGQKGEDQEEQDQHDKQQQERAEQEQDQQGKSKKAAARRAANK